MNQPISRSPLRLSALICQWEELVTRQIEVDDLHRAITQLPEKQRRRLVLYYFGGCTYEQIAEMEGCTHPAVMKSISAALEKLKNFLSGEVTI